MELNPARRREARSGQQAGPPASPAFGPDWAALELQLFPVQFGGSGDRNRLPEALLGVAAPPRMLDELFHVLRGRGTLQVHSETNAVKGGPRPV